MRLIINTLASLFGRRESQYEAIARRRGELREEAHQRALYADSIARRLDAEAGRVLSRHSYGTGNYQNGVSEE
jgi:hypothetical protein